MAREPIVKNAVPDCRNREKDGKSLQLSQVYRGFWSVAQCALKLLGDFALLAEDGSSVALPTKKDRLLLAYLALHPNRNAHAREALWPAVG